MAVKPIEKIHAAAFYFARISRDPEKIASAFNVSDRTIRRWAKTPEWHNALDRFGYTGTRELDTPKRRDTVRDAGDTFEQARQMYQHLIADGVPRHKRASKIAEALRLKPRRVREWIKRYNWNETG